MSIGLVPSFPLSHLGVNSQVRLQALRVTNKRVVPVAMLLRRLKKTASSAMRTVVDIDPGAVPCTLGSVPDAKMIGQLQNRCHAAGYTGSHDERMIAGMLTTFAPEDIKDALLNGFNATLIVGTFFGAINLDIGFGIEVIEDEESSWQSILLRVSRALFLLSGFMFFISVPLNVVQVFIVSCQPAQKMPHWCCRNIKKVTLPNQYHTRAVIITWLALVLFVLGSFELVDGIVISVATTFVTFHLFGATFVTFDSSIPKDPFELANAIATGEAGAAARDHGGPEA